MQPLRPAIHAESAAFTAQNLPLAPMQRVGHPVPVRVLVIEGRDVAGIIEKHYLPRAAISPCGTKNGSHSHEGLAKIERFLTS